MKTPAMILCALLCLGMTGDQSRLVFDPPEPAGQQPQRFQIVTASFEENGRRLVGTLRLDTATGQTWKLDELANSTLIYWTRVENNYEGATTVLIGAVMQATNLTNAKPTATPPKPGKR